MKRLLVLFLLLAQPLCAAILEGRVVDGDNPVVGIQVAAYASLDPSGAPLAVSAPTDAQGYYRLELSAGYVALFAQDPEGKRFAFCGRNPVRVTEEQPAWAGLQLVPLAAEPSQAYADEYTAGLEGRVLLAGEPVADALVYLYLDVSEDLKGQGYRLSLPTAEDGYFAFDNLPESDYFLVARKRQSGERFGPVREGDLLGYYSGNPVHLQSGTVRQVEISLVPKLKSEQGSETPNRRSPYRLTGQVVDEGGQPLAGLHVFAYREKVIGHNRPAGLSPVTTADGRFEVHLPEAGVYYVGARELYGDSPAPGELFGMYEGSADHGLEVVAGQAREVRIQVSPVTLE